MIPDDYYRRSAYFRTERNRSLIGSIILLVLATLMAVLTVEAFVAGLPLVWGFPALLALVAAIYAARAMFDAIHLHRCQKNRRR